MTGPGPSLAASAAPQSLIGGLRLPLEGLRLLARERSLWPLAALPVLLSLLAFGTGIGLVVAYAGEIHGWATSWMPALAVERWFEWLWVGPARAALAALGLLLFLTLAGAALVLCYAVASLLASPFHDLLAARVEQLLTGSVLEVGGGGLSGLVGGALRSLREELRRMLFFLSLTLPLVLVGALVPGAQLVTGPLLLALTVLFLPLDYASYTLDRRQVSFAERRRWLARHRPVVVGFGAAAFLVFSVPVLNFLAMPALVVAGTVLAVRLPPPAATAPGAGAGSSTSP